MSMQVAGKDHQIFSSYNPLQGFALPAHPCLWVHIGAETLV